ncbi:hypothetical protein E2562_034260 [Oryza meyeriana var. granulata]|uniref:DUF834 domain-containing protein n=1 Tax=Oryza meyeriana var. granulata TaxID=110450 RepID=A0A6G1ESE6_9ORYZ|nr:hypothetical protein E2562_034260 [Oryza meyeriana var. granulata]
MRGVEGTVPLRPPDETQRGGGSSKRRWRCKEALRQISGEGISVVAEVGLTKEAWQCKATRRDGKLAEGGSMAARVTEGARATVFEAATAEEEAAVAEERCGGSKGEARRRQAIGRGD